MYLEKSNILYNLKFKMKGMLLRICLVRLLHSSGSGFFEKCRFFMKNRGARAIAPLKQHRLIRWVLGRSPAKQPPDALAAAHSIIAGGKGKRHSETPPTPGTDDACGLLCGMVHSSPRPLPVYHTQLSSPYIATCQLCSGIHTPASEHFLPRPGRGSSMHGDGIGMDVFFL
jgi:hypothetical protein